MLMIKFSRVGKRNNPSFRLVVVDRAKDPWGTFIENVGNYNPHTKETNLKTDRILFWLGKGAKASDSIHNLLVSKEVIKDKKVRVSRLSKRRKERLAEKEKAAQAESAKKAAATEVPAAPAS